MELAAPLLIPVIYFFFAWGVFRVSPARALAIVAVRLVVGVPLFWVTLFMTLSKAPVVAVLLTAPLAWLMAALLDPKRTRLRILGWVVGGTALSVLVNSIVVAAIGFDLWERVHLN